MEIKKGDKGNAVVDIQQRLAALGFDLGPTGVDGFFGRWTKKAVKEFQRARDLAVSGVVDEGTWRRMVDATYKLGDRALYLRSPFFHGDDVRQLQQWLGGIGFRTDYIDGIFGPSTERAVKEFQENYDLSEDGIVGPSTLRALNNIRGLLDRNQSSVIFEVGGPADSVVTLLREKTIAVGSPTPHKRQWLSPSAAGQLLCADLSQRLSNLLEVLGAQTHFFKLRPDPDIVGDVAVIFRLDADTRPESISVRFDTEHQESRKLAELVSEALQRSLSKRIKEIDLGECASYGLPSIEVLPGEIAYLQNKQNLKGDVFKQKIAGAIFDGLKAYFEFDQT